MSVLFRNTGSTPASHSQRPLEGVLSLSSPLPPTKVREASPALLRAAQRPVGTTKAAKAAKRTKAAKWDKAGDSGQSGHWPGTVRPAAGRGPHGRKFITRV